MAKFGMGGGGGMSGAGTGFLGAPGSQARYDMTMQMLQSAMSSAGNSNNPYAAFLTPIVGSMIGARAEKAHQDARSAEVSKMTETVLGGQLDDKSRGYLEVMNNEDAPQYLQDIAESMFKGSMTTGSPAGGGSSGGGGRQPAAPATSGKSGAANRRLVGEQWIDGVLHGRDLSGTWFPYKTEDGRLVTSKNGNPVPSPAQPAIPDDPLGLKATPPATEDPLGIR
jgi:hypothetical protein